MAKLEDYSKVAVVKYGYDSYFFAIYDDGNDYQVGDMCVFSAILTAAKLTEIITIDEFKNRTQKDITAEVIGRIDVSAYEKRIELRKKKEKLMKEMSNRKKEIQKKLDDEYYASMDETYAEMLRQYESL